MNHVIIQIVPNAGIRLSDSKKSSPSSAKSPSAKSSHQKELSHNKKQSSHHSIGGVASSIDLFGDGIECGAGSSPSVGGSANGWDVQFRETNELLTDDFHGRHGKSYSVCAWPDCETNHNGSFCKDCKTLPIQLQLCFCHTHQAHSHEDHLLQFEKYGVMIDLFRKSEMLTRSFELLKVHARVEFADRLQKAGVCPSTFIRFKGNNLEWRSLCENVKQLV